MASVFNRTKIEVNGPRVPPRSSPFVDRGSEVALGAPVVRDSCERDCVGVASGDEAQRARAKADDAAWACRARARPRRICQARNPDTNAVGPRNHCSTTWYRGIGVDRSPRQCRARGARAAMLSSELCIAENDVASSASASSASFLIPRSG